MKKIIGTALVWLALVTAAFAVMTTLDPSTIVNYAGIGSLSGGNLTLSSTGVSVAASTTAATAKQTYQAAISANPSLGGIVGIASSSSSNDGFIFGWDGAHWVIQAQATGTTFATGPSSPSPGANDVYTLDCDPVGATVSIRVNGTTVFTGQSVSGANPATWKAVVLAANASSVGTTFTSTVAFSGLTYPPLAGYSEWDSGGPPPGPTLRLRTLTGVGQ